METFNFSVPQDITVGKGSLSKLPEIAKKLGGKHALIISGPHLEKMGLVKKAADYLASVDIKADTFTDIEANPSVTTVEKATAKYLESGADFIVAFGGGSPMDVAKAVGVVAKYGGSVTDYEGAHKVPGPIVPLIAIPTTAGTGSEVTAFSVITDYAKGIKYPLADFNITPDVAIVDPALAATMPKKLTAHTGMDAMTHAIEAYVSTLHCEYTDPLALHAIEMINEYLVASYNGDLDARAKMHDAQCLAGMAFSNALLGIVHSMAHKTGAAFEGGHIIHGAANAMYLPKVIKYNAKNEEAAKRYAEIADFIHLGGNTTEEKIDKLIELLRKMNDELNIPHCIKHYGEGGLPAEEGIVPEDEFLKKLPEIAANAILDACTGSNPRTIDPATMERLFTCIYYGTEVDF